MPQPDEGWSRAKLTDDRAKLVLEKMNADLKPGKAKAAKLTGAMLLREFLAQRVDHLQTRTRPLWTIVDEEDKLHLSPKALSDEELAWPSVSWSETANGIRRIPMLPCSTRRTGRRSYPPCPPLTSAAWCRQRLLRFLW